MSTPEQKALVPTIRAGGRPQPIVPQSFDDVQRVAKMAVRSELWKRGKDDSEEVAIAKCSLAIMTGADCGLSAAQSVQCIAVINGRCLIYGDAVPGVLWAHGFDIEQTIEGEGDKRTATCTITRPGGKKITRTFSVADAKKARLWDTREKVERYGKTVANDSPWFRFSDRMLGWRALGFAKSDGASDVMRGLDIKENFDSVDLTRDEYSEIKVAAKQALAIEDIPDEPAKQPATSDNGEAPNGQQSSAKAAAAEPAKRPARTDDEFKNALEAAFATAKDMDALNEHLLANEDETAERGLEQWVRDTYEARRKRLY